ncbi:MAG: hypothetical protein HOL48_05075 [Porticoccaceae bacterium]|jgi:hypothetical protein|nr:hypothetical protein [Porticoccaceae bacterium]
MGFLYWLESTSLANWVGGSLWGYPIMLTVHSVGLAIVVGLVFMMSLRFLGVMKGVPVGSISNIFPFAWFGFAINTISGLSLFTLQASWYITSVPFLLKIAGIIIGVVMMVLIQREFKVAGSSLDTAEDAPQKLKTFAIISLVAWSVGMIGGRFIAYI